MYVRLMRVVRTEEYNANIFDFNDPFGIFVDGNNIALLEDGSQLSTATVNCGLNGVPGGDQENNCELYINNIGEAVDFVFNGFTTVLNATTMVSCGVCAPSLNCILDY